MSAEEIVVACERAGIVLTAAGDVLSVDAPVGAMTQPLRDALARHKQAVVAVLLAKEHVVLKGGLILPAAALRLAWNLEERGFRITPTPDNGISVEPVAALTGDDKRAIAQWRLHLCAIVGYVPPEVV